MMNSKRKRKTTRFVFGWMMSGYLVLLVVLGASSLFLVPKEAKATDVCLVAGACFKSEACKEIEGAEFRRCAEICSDKQPKDKKQGCGKCQSGEGYCFPPRKGIELAINIGGTTKVYDTSQYLESVYDFAIGIAGGIAGVMLMIGGFQYLTAGGAADRVSAAKKRISDALVGLALVLGAFLLLNTISPDLVNMSEFRVPMIQKKIFTACNDYVFEQKCGQGFDLVEKDPADGKRFKPDLKEEGGLCTGMSCSLAGADDVKYKCAASNPQGRATATHSTPIEPYQCIACEGFGTDCTDVGASDQCCTGFCGANAFSSGGTCTTGAAGDKCGAGNQCKSGRCQAQNGFTLLKIGKSCTQGLFGSPCEEDGDCTGYRCINDICTVSKPFGMCDQGWIGEDKGCPDGYRCDVHLGLDIGVSLPPKSPIGAEGTLCVPQDAVFTRCGLLSGSCPSGYACVYGIATGAIGFCTDGEIGSICLSDNDCKLKHCVLDAYKGRSGGLCSNGEIGTRCDDDDDCKDRKCYEGTAWNVCVAGEPGNACSKQTHCGEGLKCDDINKRCIAK